MFSNWRKSYKLLLLLLFGLLWCAAGGLWRYGRRFRCAFNRNGICSLRRRTGIVAYLAVFRSGNTSTAIFFVLNFYVHTTHTLYTNCSIYWMAVCIRHEYYRWDDENTEINVSCKNLWRAHFHNIYKELTSSEGKS